MTKPVKSSGMARYEDVDSSYLEKRQLQRSAGWVLLWALGVGAVISGEFSGWNLGLGVGGFGGLAVATVLMAVMYLCMVFSIAELSSALPHAGGSYSFSRNAFGPFGGFINGVTDAAEFVLTPAVVVFFIGETLAALEPLSGVPRPVWWVLFYIIFVGINIIGVELTLKVTLLVTVVAASLLVVFCAGGLGKFDPALLVNIPDAAGQVGNWFPKGFSGIYFALPFAIWFFLGIEQLPLAAEEAHDSARDVPKALTTGIATLLVLSFIVLIINSGVPATGAENAVGALAISKSGAPFADGVKAVFGEGFATSALIVLSLTGLVASFHAILYGAGRVIFSLSRAGYFPRGLSVTGRFKTPDRALIASGVIGLGALLLISFFAQADPISAASILLNMAVLAAVFSYAMNMLSFIKLRLSRPSLERPYRSPFGIPGAAIGTVLAVVAFASCFADPLYQKGAIGLLIYCVIMTIYFVAYSSKRLVAQAPEEENALLESAMHELGHETGSVADIHLSK